MELDLPVHGGQLVPQRRVLLLEDARRLGLAQEPPVAHAQDLPAVPLVDHEVAQQLGLVSQRRDLVFWLQICESIAETCSVSVRLNKFMKHCKIQPLTSRGRYVYEVIEEIVRVHISVGNREGGLWLLLALLTCGSALTANEPLRKDTRKEVLVREHLKLVGLRRRRRRLL